MIYTKYRKQIVSCLYPLTFDKSNYLMNDINSFQVRTNLQSMLYEYMTQYKHIHVNCVNNNDSVLTLRLTFQCYSFCMIIVIYKYVP